VPPELSQRVHPEADVFAKSRSGKFLSPMNRM
jgi:hypothetical protein